MRSFSTPERRHKRVTAARGRKKGSGTDNYLFYRFLIVILRPDAEFAAVRATVIRLRDPAPHLEELDRIQPGER